MKKMLTNTKDTAFTLAACAVLGAAIVGLVPEVNPVYLGAVAAVVGRLTHLVKVSW